MITITTSKGKTYPVAYAWAPLWNGNCGIALAHDDRLLSEIAAEFEGLTTIHLHDPDGNPAEIDFDGYTELIQIQRSADAVQMTLAKGDS